MREAQHLWSFALWSSSLLWTPKRRQSLGHWITGTRPKSTHRRSIFNIAVGQVKSASGFGARQATPLIASFSGSHFQCPQQGAAHSPEPRIRRYLVEAYRAHIGYGFYR